MPITYATSCDRFVTGCSLIKPNTYAETRKLVTTLPTYIFICIKKIKEMGGVPCKYDKYYKSIYKHILLLYLFLKKPVANLSQIAVTG
jgi:hypothetical protein